MSITNYQTTQIGDAVLVKVTSDLVGTVYYHWYLDGIHQGSTTAPEWTFSVAPGEQARVEVIDTLDPGFDAIAGAPASYSARRTIYWVASLAADVEAYRVEQQAEGGDWESLGLILATPGQWTYWTLSPRLDDLTEYTWRIVPIDLAGNDGSPVVIDEELVVRTPDAPFFTAAFDADTQRVTFTEAT